MRAEIRRAHRLFGLSEEAELTLEFEVERGAIEGQVHCGCCQIVRPNEAVFGPGPARRSRSPWASLGDRHRLPECSGTSRARSGSNDEKPSDLCEERASIEVEKPAQR